MSGYGNFSNFYDALTENVGYSERCEYICSLLHGHGIDGGLLLDLACGTGSMSVELSRAGFDVIGVDASAAMLCEAQNKASAAKQDILFLCQRMQELDLYGTVRAAVCTLDSINHLIREEDVRETFRRVSLFLEPGGVFIFDVNTVYKHKHILADNVFVYDTDEVYCVWQNRLREKTDTVEITLDFFTPENGVYRRSSESFCERAYETDKIARWLSDAGFSVAGIYGEMTMSEPQKDAQRVVFVAVKQ
jgi:ubiquinone/menaquinone biosynthesis C-methylase UbiE